MSPEETFFLSIVKKLKESELSQMFGKPCIKINGKAFACFFQNCMVFKLTGLSHKTALTLEGSQLFDPSGRGRAMKEWVQVGFQHKERWNEFAKEARKYVSES